MTWYQPLEEEHLNITTVAVNPAQRGTRHASLAWFWSIDVQGNIEAVDAMAECMCIILVKFYFTNLQHVIPGSLVESKGSTRSLEGRSETSLP